MRKEYDLSKLKSRRNPYAKALKKAQYLSAEEKEIMKAIERDEFVPVTGPALKRMAEAIAARKKSLAKH